MNEITWHVVPSQTPNIIRHCSKCNRKMPYYCSEKFRANANQSRVDVWLIFKCSKCDNTWKLMLFKGIRPHELPAGLFDKFIDNDKNLAWQYAFDRNLLKQHDCIVDYSDVDYIVENEPKSPNYNHYPSKKADKAISPRRKRGEVAVDFQGETLYNEPVLIYVKCLFSFDLKLSALLAKMLNTSIGQIKRLVENGNIITCQDIDIMKYRFKTEHDISVRIDL